MEEGMTDQPDLRQVFNELLEDPILEKIERVEFNSAWWSMIPSEWKSKAL